jgi:hypothetical protein
MTRLRPRIPGGASARQARLRPDLSTKLGVALSPSKGELRGGASARLRSFAATALTTAAAVMIAGGSSALACPQCFGAEETTLLGGTKLGVLVLLAVTLVVQGGFVGFFLYLRRRARRFTS